MGFDRCGQGDIKGLTNLVFLGVSLLACGL